MPLKTLKIATRESPLAMWQAHHIREQLLGHWPDLNIELIPMKTTGDKFLKDKLINTGGKGLFVKELEEALLDKRADLAVHSMKDVPVSFPEGLLLSTICKRHNPFDALVSKKFSNIASLPFGATIGTVSLRRQTQLLALRPDLQMKLLRGNILTRIDKMESGEYDAIILAVSGLERMEMQDKIQAIFNPDSMLPSCGQGALGIECREEDETLHKLLAPLNDNLTARCVKTERHVNALLGGNCHAPLAIYCAPQKNDKINLSARLLSLDGQKMIQHSSVGSLKESESMAEKCAQSLLAQGGAELIEAALKS